MPMLPLTNWTELVLVPPVPHITDAHPTTKICSYDLINATTKTTCRLERNQKFTANRKVRTVLWWIRFARVAAFLGTFLSVYHRTERSIDSAFAGGKIYNDTLKNLPPRMNSSTIARLLNVRTNSVSMNFHNDYKATATSKASIFSYGYTATKSLRDLLREWK